jgi:hypothetical protein
MCRTSSPLHVVELQLISLFPDVSAQGEEPEEDTPTVEPDIGSSRDGSKTDDEVVQRCVCVLSHTPPFC